MNRRQQLQQLTPQLLDIFDDDRGAIIVTMLDGYAAALDENDDLISGTIIIETDDTPYPNRDYQIPDVG